MQASRKQIQCKRSEEIRIECLAVTETADRCALLHAPFIEAPPPPAHDVMQDQVRAAHGWEAEGASGVKTPEFLRWKVAIHR